MTGFSAAGVIPACLLPLHADGRIDEAGYRRHLRDLAGIQGLGGIVVNGHAAEAHALSFDEQVRTITWACEEVGGRIAVIAGVCAEGTRQACALARAATAAGADALLIFPPNSLMFGGNARPELGARFVHEVAAASTLPIVLFQYPLSTALSYAFDTLVSLCESIGHIVAIKDLGSDPRVHETTIAALHGLARPVNVLTSHSQWLGASLSMGARGIISGAGSVIGDRQRALFDAFTSPAPNPELQRQCLAEMSLLVEAFYAAPYVNWQARMKQTLHHFGRFVSAHVFAPLQPPDEADWNRTRALLERAGLSSDTLYCR